MGAELIVAPATELIRNRLPSMVSHRWMLNMVPPPNIGTGKRASGDPALKTGAVVTGTAIILEFADMKSISLPSWRHTGSVPPSFEIGHSVVTLSSGEKGRT